MDGTILGKKYGILDGTGGGGGVHFPTEYSNEDLVGTGFKVNAGGYAKIGNLVVVNILLEATDSGNCSVEGFPEYSEVVNTDIVLCNVYDQNYGDPYKNVKITKSGSITFLATGGWSYLVSAVYICNS